jgi:hypothetical protein
VAELPISQELAEKLLHFAQQHNRSLEDILAGIVEDEQSRPPVNYTRFEDAPNYQAAERRILPKMFARARAYWKSVGDKDRLALSDEQLFEQFWCFDPDGIPRLKSDQDHITLPPDPLEAATNRQWQRWQKNGQIEQTGTEDLDTRRILNEEFPNYLMRRLEDNDNQ